MNVKQNPKAKANNRTWSTADDATLIKMARGGASGAEIAKILGRTIIAVCNRKYNLGVDVRLASSKGKETDAPRTLSKNKSKSKSPKKVTVTVKEISRVPLAQNPLFHKELKWTKEEDVKMFELTERGEGNKKIATLLGRTEKSVKNRKYYLKKKDENQSPNQPAANEVIDATPNYQAKESAIPSGRGRKPGSKNKTKMVQMSINRSGVNAYQSAEEEFDVIKRMAKKYGATITIKIG
jgi:DNA-binding CsgD family transcriptional regulator